MSHRKRKRGSIIIHVTASDPRNLLCMRIHVSVTLKYTTDELSSLGLPLHLTVNLPILQITILVHSVDIDRSVL